MRYSPIKHKIFNEDNSINYYEIEKLIEQNKLQKYIIRFYFVIVILFFIVILFALIFIN